jgi:hypothetical protein
MWRLLVSLGLLLAVGAATARAQAQKPFIIEGFGAYTVPTGDFSVAVKASPGFGVGLGYYVSPALLVMGNFNWAMMKAKNDAIDGLDEDILTFQAGLGYDVTAAQPSVSVIPYLAAGMTMFRYEILDATESENKFSASAGLRLYYWFSPTIGLIAGAAANLILVGSNELEPEASNSKLIIPTQLGVVLAF